MTQIKTFFNVNSDLTCEFHSSVEISTSTALLRYQKPVDGVPDPGVLLYQPKRTIAEANF